MQSNFIDMIRSTIPKFSMSRKITKNKWVLKRHRKAHFVRRKLMNGSVYKIKVVLPHYKVWILGVQTEMPVKSLAHTLEKLC